MKEKMEGGKLELWRTKCEAMVKEMDELDKKNWNEFVALAKESKYSRMFFFMKRGREWVKHPEMWSLIAAVEVKDLEFLFEP
jgi:hypothetical protein